MKTPAVIASLTVAGSLAFAAGQQTTGKHPPVLVPGAQAHSMQEEMPQARMAQAAGGCAPEPWLSGTLMPFSSQGCGAIAPGELPITNVDVNADGVVEVCSSREPFLFPYPPRPYVVVTTQYGSIESRSSTEFMTATRLSPSPDGPVITTSGVFPDVRAFCKGLITEIGNYQPCIAGTYWFEVAFEPNGWLDCDGDGDLDLVATWGLSRLDADDGAGCLPFQTPLSGDTVWFENTGFEQPNPPLTGDVTGDGAVNGADLAVVLGNWTASD